MNANIHVVGGEGLNGVNHCTAFDHQERFNFVLSIWKKSEETYIVKTVCKNQDESQEFPAKIVWHFYIVLNILY